MEWTRADGGEGAAEGRAAEGVESEPTGREGQREGDRDRAANSDEGGTAARVGRHGPARLVAALCVCE